MPRPTWDEYFMEITKLVAKRSTCKRRQVGALLVKTNGFSQLVTMVHLPGFPIAWIPGV